MKILFFTLGDETVASSRTRVFQYLPHLQGLGVQYRVIQFRTGLDYRLLALNPRGKIQACLIVIALKGVALFHLFYSTLQSARLLLVGPFSDIIFIQKVLLPIPLQCLLLRFNPRVVFEYDDALYANEQSYSKRRLEAQLSRCRLAVLENENTEKFAKRFHIPTVRITGPMDCMRYRPNPAVEEGASASVIGWIGSRSTTGYLELLRKPLRAIAEKHPQAVLELVGAGPIDIPGVRVRRIPWALDTEVERLRRFDIGIMPLEDNEFTRGKGAYKIMQYMAMGIPAVASPVGVNSEVLLSGVTGYLCASDDEWFEALDRLFSDAALRTSMGRAGRERVVKVYSFEASAPRLLKALETV